MAQFCYLSQRYVDPKKLLQVDKDVKTKANLLHGPCLQGDKRTGQRRSSHTTNRYFWSVFFFIIIIILNLKAQSLWHRKQL